MNPLSKLKHAWNVFSDDKHLDRNIPSGMQSNYINPSRRTFTRGNERTLVTSVYNRLAIDVSSVDIRHVKLDQNGRFNEFVLSGLDNCLHTEANLDQTASNFIQDIVISVIDEGVVAVVPVETTVDPTLTESYKIHSMRTGKIVAWFPDRVTVSLYDERDGITKDITCYKSQIAIIENPFYSIMNEHNSTMQRLIRKLAMMDAVDEDISSGGIDLIVQLPQLVRGEAKKALAEERRKEIETQLNGAKYGIGYIDASEKITQLNRSVENHFMKDIEYLTQLLYAQLGLTQAIMDGTADENTMNNYFSRTIEPFLGAIVDEFNRKFLSKTARSQSQAIKYYRDPFKLMPVTSIAEIADKFTRNEIMSSNEIRQIVGMKPSDDPAADELRNKNLSQAKTAIEAKQSKQPGKEEPEKSKKEENNEEL